MNACQNLMIFLPKEYICFLYRESVGLRIERSWVRSPQASPCCLLEQDTLTVQPRKRWLRPDIDRKIVDWDLLDKHKKNCWLSMKKSYFKIFRQNSLSFARSLEHTICQECVITNEPHHEKTNNMVFKPV